MLHEVPVGALREAFVASGLTVAEAARRYGCDAEHARRLLRGRPLIRRGKGGQRWEVHTNSVAYETAIRWCRALDLDPVDLGL